MTAGTRWTTAEAATLAQHYGAGLPWPRLLALLPGRTRKQIANKASALGLRQPRAARLPQQSLTEHAEQAALFRWAALLMPRHPALALLYAVPNGGQRHIRVAAKLKAEGVKAGVPDVCLPVARHGQHGLYIELKRRASRSARGTVRPQQKWWHDRLRAEGYRVVVCEGWDAARDAIMAYLGLTA